VQIVPGPGFCAAVEARIRDGLRARLGADVQIDIEHERAIPPERSGKHRYVVSRVTS
jgi:phenylacetate-CoA ligase